jgi:hypothetical protein
MTAQVFEAARGSLWQQIPLVQDAGVRARFLFGPTIGDLYGEVIVHALNSCHAIERLRALDLGTPEHDALSKEVLNGWGWFGRTRQDLHRHFGAYLDFSEWTRARPVSISPHTWLRLKRRP